MNKLIVLIPHYNSPTDLVKTIASISESFPLDVLIIDDGSKEKPLFEQLKVAFRNEGELKIVSLYENQGIEKALNEGLKQIKKTSYYKYVGRLDAGDLSVPNKFGKQLKYLENNPDVFLLGTWAEVVNEEMKHLYYLNHPVNQGDIKKKMYINSCFIHPSVVYRSEVINTIGFYPENRKSAEDYAYFFKIVKKYKTHNLPEYLLRYVVSDRSISSQKRNQQIQSRIKIILDNFYLGFYPIYGLIRNTLLLLIPQKTILFFKNKFSKK